MIDVKIIRNEPERLRAALIKRHASTEVIEQFTELDVRRRQLLVSVESLKSTRNTVSQEVARKKRQGEDAEDLILQMRTVGDQIKTIDDQVRELDENLEVLLLTIPNIPHESVPEGESDEENVEIRKVGTPAAFIFQPKAHYDLAVNLDILDFERAGKVTGTRFVFYKALGARLERALINYMIDKHTTVNGYTEILPPFLVNRASMTGTGQLPKFEEDAFKVVGTDYFMIPTAEVPVTNFYRDEILKINDLPQYFVAYTPCFRSEAGSAGRDTRGLIRMHQFNKVEMVKFVLPETSYQEWEKLVSNAEGILQDLRLPYRVVDICGGDLGFSGAKQVDLEVWLPSFGVYREISSCSNFEDFQARRANIRFRREQGSRPEFVHTINGSGLAIGRTVAAILENYQTEDGSVEIPEVLVPYMGGITRLSRAE